MTNKLERTRKQPIFTAVIALLFALSCIFWPTDFFGESIIARLSASALIRFIFAGIGLFLLFRWGLADVLRLRLKKLNGIDVFVIALIIVLNNFPFFALLQKSVTLSANAMTTFMFVLQCLSVGLFEEIFFRGLIFSLFLLLFPDTKRGHFLAILISSAIFGLTHLANLFGGGALAPVLLQVGYSFLIGAMLSTVMLFTRTIWTPVLLHTLFNVGGLMIETLGGGNLWTLGNIILTAVLAVLAVIYLIIRFIRSPKQNLFWKQSEPVLPLEFSTQSDIENHHDDKSDNTTQNG